MATKAKAKASAKAPGPPPLDLTTLSRWLAADPAGRLKALGAAALEADDAAWRRLAEPYRCALAWAWDEQPEPFWQHAGPWLKGKDARLRALATGALPLSHEGQRKKVLEALRRQLGDKAEEVRLTAADLLLEDFGAHHEDAARLATAPDPALRALVARHAGWAEGADATKKAVALLEPLALAPEPAVHWAAAAALAELHDREPRAALELARKMAVSEDEDVRWAVAASFFEPVLGDGFDQLLPTIRAWLRGPDLWLRWTLVRSLRFVRATARSLLLLKALYEDKDPEVRRRVAQHLVELFERGTEAGRAVGELLRRCKVDASRRVREVVEEGEARHQVDFDRVPRPGQQLADLPDEVVVEGDDGEEAAPSSDDDDDDD